MIYFAEKGPGLFRMCCSEEDRKEGRSEERRTEEGQREGRTQEGRRKERLRKEGLTLAAQ